MDRKQLIRLYQNREIKMNIKAVLGMASYNSGEGHIYESIKSIQAQTFRNFELIIYEDPSENSLPDKVIKLIQSDPRITYIQGDKRLGSCGSFNLLLKQCIKKNVQYFAWVTDHDLFHESWLESLIEKLEKDRNAVVAYPRKKNIDSLGKEVTQNTFLASDVLLYENDHMSVIKRIISFAFLRSGTGDIAHGLFKVDTLKKSNIEWPTKITTDKLFLLRLMKFGSIVSVNQILFFRREKEEEIEFTKSNRMIERQFKSVFIGKTPKIYSFLNYRLVNFLYLLKHELILGAYRKQNILLSLLVPLSYFFGSLMILFYHFQGFFSNKLKKK